MKISRTISIVVILTVVVLGVGYFFRDTVTKTVFQPTETTVPDFSVEGQDAISISIPAMLTLADSLSIPWDVVELPDESLLIPERAGDVIHLTPNGGRAIVETFDDIRAQGEGGLLGMTLHPDFESNRWIYVYQTYEEGEQVFNRVLRFTLDDSLGFDRETTIIDRIPGRRFHNGGMLRFGPPMACVSGEADCKLYITTGDAGDASLAQDVTSLAGKILRLNDDGTAPVDNPFPNAPLVYSYGHRNPQGLAWDEEGILWSTEHGRSGVQSGFDELNRVIAGGNYGWPEIQGDEEQSGMIPPVLHSGPTDTWAPASLAYVDGTFYWGGLRGEGIYVADRAGDQVVNLRMYFREEFGRIRAVVVGNDSDYLFVTTSNTDGRGFENEGDDIVLRLARDLFEF